MRESSAKLSILRVSATSRRPSVRLDPHVRSQRITFVLRPVEAYFGSGRHVSEVRTPNGDRYRETITRIYACENCQARNEIIGSDANHSCGTKEVAENLAGGS